MYDNDLLRLHSLLVIVDLPKNGKFDSPKIPLQAFSIPDFPGRKCRKAKNLYHATTFVLPSNGENWRETIQRQSFLK